MLKVRATEPISRKLVGKNKYIRGKIVGKRVFYIARSVISCDPKIDL